MASWRIGVAVGAVAIGGWVLVGCGGGNDVGSAGPDPTSGTEGAVTDGAQDTGAAGASPTTARISPETFLPDDIPLPIDQECRDVYSSIVSAFAGVGGGADQEAFAGMADAFTRLRELVPADLQGSVDVMATTYGELDALLSQYGYDFTVLYTDPEAQAAFTALLADEDGEFAEASSQVGQWVEEQCGEG